MTTATTSVPADLDPSDVAQLEPLYASLSDRAVESTDDLRVWLSDYAALEAVVDEYGSRAYIAKTCHTEDKEIEKAFLHFVEVVDPALKPWRDKLRRKFLDSPHSAELAESPYPLLTRHWRADVELFRESNIELQTKDAKIGAEYDKICGAQTVEYGGQTLTMQQAFKYLEETDRDVRREVFDLTVRRRLEDRDRLDTMFDELLELRYRIAQNANKPDYRAYMWQAMKRFDYTPQHCHDYADAVEACVVPFMAELHEKRKAELDVDALRPYDLSVDPKGRPPLRPFAQDDIDGFVARTRAMFDGVSPDLGEQFGTMRMGDNLDLDSRLGKAPGGYQSSLEVVKEPFIFMNATGRQDDIETMLHEGGHAFHFIESSRAVPLMFVRHAPIEFCEVASMSMELMAADGYGAFYDDPADAARAKRSALERSLTVLPWVAAVDDLQHWLYTHPGHSSAQRIERWLQTWRRFTPDVTDWSGYEDYLEMRWQAQLHLYRVPFYYIEYGIAELGALQLWLNYKRDSAGTVAAYRSALALGGTRPLPELFEAAGIKFDFTRATIEPLVDAVRAELTTLPE